MIFFFDSCVMTSTQWFPLPTFWGLDFLSMPLALCSPLDNLLTRLRVSRLTAFSSSNERRYSSSSFPPSFLSSTELPIVVRDVAYALLAVGRSPFFLRVLPTFAFSNGRHKENYIHKKEKTNENELRLLVHVVRMHAFCTYISNSATLQRILY